MPRAPECTHRQWHKVRKPHKRVPGGGRDCHCEREQRHTKQVSAHSRRRGTGEKHPITHGNLVADCGAPQRLEKRHKPHRDTDRKRGQSHGRDGLFEGVETKCKWHRYSDEHRQRRPRHADNPNALKNFARANFARVNFARRRLKRLAVGWSRIHY